MSAWLIGPWAPLACFVLSAASAIVPWLNAEALLLALSTTARSWPALAVLVVLTAAGQMLGKSILYGLARAASRRYAPGQNEKVVRWRRRFESSPRAALGIVFVSAAVSVPPFYVVTLAAGACGMGFGSFVGAGWLGRLVRFGALVSVPRLVISALS